MEPLLSRSARSETHDTLHELPADKRILRKDNIMRTCAVCHFPVVPDDWEIVFESGSVLCVDCFHREAGTALPMSKELRQQLEAILNNHAAGY